MVAGKLSRDPAKYPEPDLFNPDRFLNPRYPTFKEPLKQFPNLEGDTQFGFGRRSCPGTNLVQAQCFSLFAAVAWAFDIKRRKNKFGLEDPIPASNYNSLMITKPNAFQMDLVPRSDNRRTQILKEARLGEP